MKLWVPINKCRVKKEVAAEMCSMFERAIVGYDKLAIEISCDAIWIPHKC